MNLLIRQLKIIGKSLGRVLWGQSRLQKLRKARIDARFQRAREEIYRQSEVIRQIKRFPKLDMTKREFSFLPKAGEVDLKTCPIGTRFVCKPLDYYPDFIVVGHVVRGLDAFCDQYGSGMSVPERFVNRYQVGSLT